MCGIFGYKGKQNAGPILYEGLNRLLYRGYDSWGIAVAQNNSIFVEKQVGKISDFKKIKAIPFAHSGIAHTRWATHGKVTIKNAHPHYATDHSFVLAQNGIVENFAELKKELIKKKYSFISETDTEVIVRLIEKERMKTHDLIKAVRHAFQKLKGRNTIIVLTTEGKIISCRNGSPLIVGLNTHTDEFYIASDILSCAPHAKKMIMIDNGQMIVIDQKLTLFSIKTGKKIIPNIEPITLKNSIVDKGSFDHFMIKEIHEAPFTVETILNNGNKYADLATAIKKARSVYTIGSGTAGAAAAQIAFYFREYADINAISLIGGDAQEYVHLFTSDDLIIAPSQSGETADVLEILEYAKEKKVSIASFVNMPGSMMTRMSDFRYIAHAGPEICVMSTKIFVSQIAWGYLMAKITAEHLSQGIKNLRALQKNMTEYLHDKKNHASIKKIATLLAQSPHIFILAKGQNFQIAKEGMVKIIEGSYKHAHAIPAGDLKHYAITLVEKNVPVVVVASDDSTKKDILNAVYEVKARGATVIGITPFTDSSFDHTLITPDTTETSAIMNVIPLQLLAYYMAVHLGNNVDKPRNIAKSVTVK